MKLFDAGKRSNVETATVGADDLLIVQVPDRTFRDVVEIVTIDARTGDPAEPGRVTHVLRLSDKAPGDETE